MPISFECSDCGAALKVKEQYSGRKIKCPHCQAVNRVPAETEGSDDDDVVVSRTRSSSTSSRSKQSRRSQPRRSRTDEDEELEELPQPSRRKKKKTSQKSKSGSGGKVPVWAIVAGSSLAGVLIIALIVFIATKPPAQAANGQVAGGAQPAEQPKIVQAQVDGPGAKFRMKFEMPAGWTSEGSIEDEMFPWATMKGEGQSIKLSSNRSLAGGAEAMTTVGGAIEQLKMSHSTRGHKLEAESTDWVEGQLNIHEGKRGPVIWSNYEYKGMFGKGYGIRCTVDGPVRPCTMMLECSESARDKWRPTLLAIAESIDFVGMKDGQEERDDFGVEPGDKNPNADPAEKDGDPEDQQ